MPSPPLKSLPPRQLVLVGLVALVAAGAIAANGLISRARSTQNLVQWTGAQAVPTVALAAAFDAGSTRFRPVLMTALAMIIGMAPMAIEPGQNAPLGRAVIGGLLFATCATLFLVPTLFSLVHARDHQKAKPSPPAVAALTQT